MTIRTVTTLPNGDVKEVVSNAKGAPLVFLNGVLQRPAEYQPTGSLWKEWYAWRPVKDIHGEWHWLEKIYRKVGNTYVDYDNWTWYYYGTLFDVLGDKQ